MSNVNFMTHGKAYEGNYLVLPYDNENEYSMGLHYHDFYEIQFLVEGEGTLNINYKDYLNRKGDVVFINIFSPHQFRFSPGNYHKRYSVSLSPAFLLNASTDNSNLISLFSGNTKKPAINLPDEAFKQLNLFFERYEKIDGKYGKDLKEMALIYEMLALLFGYLYEDEHPDNTDQHFVNTILKLVRYIDMNISGDLNLERLAKEINFSKYYTCRLFKKYTGYTLNQYILSKRMEKAKHMLSEQISIFEVSKSSGFNNYSHFYKTFRETFGMSPSEYRISNRK